MNVGQKIREIRKARNLSISDVEVKAGISEGNLSRIETGKQWPREETFKAIADALDCHVADFFNEHTPADQRGKQVPIISYADSAELRKIANPERLHQKLTHYLADHATDWIPTIAETSRNIFALRIEDNAMAPEFLENDHVIIDPELAPNPGDFILAMVNEDEMLFRKFRPREMKSSGQLNFHLVALNLDYPVIQSENTPITIVGTMLEHRRYRKN